MEALILLFIVLVFGFFSFPLYSYFALIAVYSFTFFDVGITFWSIFIVLGAVFLIPSLRLKLKTLISGSKGGIEQRNKSKWSNFV